MSMGIVVRRTGGYAGTEIVSKVDTARLDPARRSRIEQLLRKAAATLAHASEPIGADLMKYEITVEENGATRTLSWTDDGSTTSSGPFRELLEELQQLA